MSLPGLTLGELLAHDFPEPRVLLGPWLREQTFAMVHAPAGCGKSMLCLSAALAVAGGGRFLGWEAPSPARVLYVDAEMTGHELQSRARLLSGTVPEIDLEAAYGNLMVVGRHLGGGDESFPVIEADDAAGRETIKQWSANWKADLVILDNLTKLGAIKDENSAAECAPVLALADDLKAAGRAVILVHHNAKSGDSYRGSTALDAPLDVRIGLKPLSHPSASEGTSFRLSFYKKRDLLGDSAQDFQGWLEVGPEGAQWASSQVEAAPRGGDDVAAYVEALRSRLYRTQGELAEALGWPKDKASKVKGRVRKAGLLADGEAESIFREVREVELAEDY